LYVFCSFIFIIFTINYVQYTVIDFYPLKVFSMAGGSHGERLTTAAGKR